VLHILRPRYGPAWSESVRVIYVGDDHTDEDAATRRLPDVAAVRRLLPWLARRGAARSARA
jgi:hypothetical protein